MTAEYQSRVRAGKRTQEIRVRSSCFGCLATLQRRHLEYQGSSLLTGTACGRSVRCVLCCLFERYKRVFGTFFSLLEMEEKACPSLASENRVFILGYLERARNSDDIALFQFLSRPLSRQLAILFLYTVPIGQEYAPP